VIFEGTLRTGGYYFHGDMAIDDVSATMGPCGAAGIAFPLKMYYYVHNPIFPENVLNICSEFP
jgi:hypothetical protein